MSRAFDAADEVFFGEDKRPVAVVDPWREIEALDGVESDPWLEADIPRSVGDIRRQIENRGGERVILTEAILIKFCDFLDHSSLHPRKLACAIRILLHKETRSAAEVAKHFRISRAAISKQVRLLAVYLDLPSPGQRHVEPARRRAKERWRRKKEKTVRAGEQRTAISTTIQQVAGVNSSELVPVNPGSQP